MKNGDKVLFRSTDSDFGGSEGIFKGLTPSGKKCYIEVPFGEKSTRVIKKRKEFVKLKEAV